MVTPPVTRPVSSSQFADLLPAPPEISAAFKTFSLQAITAPRHITTTFADHVLGLHVAGAHRLRHLFGGQVTDGRSEPGALHVIPANVDLSVESSAESRALVVFIPPAYLSRIVAQHWDVDPSRVAIVRQFLIRDAVVESVMRELAREVRQGSPLGSLYAESACEFLAHHIVYSYSSMSGQPSRARGGLTGRRLKIVMNYIHDNLGQAISLHSLAALVGIGPRHFERAFRQAVGLPPHAYVMEQRVAAARVLLIKHRSLTIENIARRVGFANSSHLGAAFRRLTGNSPAAFRALRSR